ncbi:MAG: PDZ domain-containing protein [Planctomycetes bacterium]|nr:PDZ domain-containing protein [Planctomycetota bacterium]
MRIARNHSQHGIVAAVALVGLLAGSPVFAQDTKAEAKQETRVEDVTAIRSAIEKLASTDFDARRAAADELVARGHSVVAELEKVVSESKDPELRWQARRVLRRIDRQQNDAHNDTQDSNANEGRDPATATPGTRRLERVRRGPVQRRAPQDRRGFDLDFPGIDPDFAERIREQIEQMLPPGQGFRLAPGQAGTQSGSSLKVEIGPNGVNVEESTNENGKESVKKYSAKDMESLLQKHPELMGRIGVAPRITMPDFGSLFGRGASPFGGRSPFQGSPFQGAPFQGSPFEDLHRDLGSLEERMRELEERLRSGRLTSPWPRAGESDDGAAKGQTDTGGAEKPSTDSPSNDDQDQPAPLPQGPTLGVMIRDSIPEGVRAYLELENGVGLWVDSVVDGSLAAKAGVRAGDILVSIGSTSLRGPADVRSALSAIKANDAGVLTLIRKGVTQRVELAR